MLNVNPQLSAGPQDPGVRTNRWNEGERNISGTDQTRGEHTAALVFLSITLSVA